MKLFATLLLLLVCGITSVWAAPSDGFYRWPSAYGNHVAFIADNDLWIAPLSGGTARRLTSAPGEERFAMFSPDGKWIAFSGNYEGNVDVYIVSPDGGEPRRLTYHPGADWVASWTPDGKVAFRNAFQNGQYNYEMFTVSVEGEWPQQLNVFEAAHIAFEPKGDRIAYTRFSLGFRTWKRYKGGWAEDIYVGSTKSGDYKKVTTWEGNDATPMWYGDRIYYIRNNDDRDNLWCMNPDGSDVKILTAHKDYDARWPSLVDGKIAYTVGADIYYYDLASGTEHMVNVKLPGEMLQTRDKFVSPEDYTSDFALSPDGNRITLGARGELFSASTERRSVILQLTDTPGSRERSPFYSKDGKEIFAWTDTEGEQTLWAYPADGKGKARKVGPGPSTFNFGVDMSPNGEWGVAGNKDRTLALINLKTGATSVIDSSDWEIYSYEWSPDSRYVAYSVTLPNKFNGVKIYDTKEKVSHLVTDPMFDSYSPTWDPDGKWIYFVSSRFMNAFSGVNDYSFITLGTDQLFGLALTKDTKSPYLYEDNTIEGGDKKDDEKKEDDDKKDKKDKGDKKDDKEEEKKVDVKIDWDGLINRIVLFPKEAGNYSGLAAVEGKLYYFTRDIRGWKGDPHGDEDDPAVALHCYDIKKQKDHKVVDDARGYMLSLDRKKLVVRKKDDFVMLDAGDTEEPEPDKDDKDKGLKLGEWTHDVEPLAEWKQIYWEAWRLQRDFFYDPNMHGVDWKKQGDRYAKLIERISNRDELNDIIGQLFGELSAGHAYISGGDRERQKSVSVGLLGIDVTRESNGFYKIDKVLAPDPWDKDRTSPLSQVGIDVKPGDYLVAIDRKPVSDVASYYQLLTNKADKLVMVSVNSKPSLEGAREYVVKTMGSERELRYWDWVKDRMEYVKKNGGDDIAYLHLSDMGGDGMEQFMREYYPQVYGKKAFIFDVRNNGGGNIARWILSDIDRKIWSWGVARNGQRDHDPFTSFQGHRITLCDEQTGSDGETFCEGWKRLKLGPVVGMRTWGGWVGIRGGKGFIDGGGSTQPEFTGYGADSKWLIEGPGVTPDVTVENSQKNLMEGKDDQLDYAIKWCRDQIKTNPVNDPPMPKFPIKAATGPNK